MLCPLSLTEKWRKELSEKFDIDAPILRAGELLDVLQSSSRRARGGTYICARDSIRPDRGWDGEEEYFQDVLNNVILLCVSRSWPMEISF